MHQCPPQQQEETFDLLRLRVAATPPRQQKNIMAKAVLAAVGRVHPHNAEALANHSSAMDDSRILAAFQSQANLQFTSQEARRDMKNASSVIPSTDQQNETGSRSPWTFPWEARLQEHFDSPCPDLDWICEHLTWFLSWIGLPLLSKYELQQLESSSLVNERACLFKASLSTGPGLDNASYLPSMPARSTSMTAVLWSAGRKARTVGKFLRPAFTAGRF